MSLTKLSKKDFAAAIAHGTVLVEFGTPWCAPCRTMLPLLDQLAGELAGRVSIASVDVDEEQDLGQRYEIRALPTMIVFVDGVPVDELRGSQPKQCLRERLERLLAARAA